MYSIVASVWYRYCIIRWIYTKFLMYHGASVKGIFWLAQRFKWVAAKTKTSTHPSVFIFLQLNYVTWLFPSLNWALWEYGGIIAQSWWNLLNVKWSLRKDVTQSIKCLSRAELTICRISGMIIVIGEMHSILQKKPSKVPTTRSWRHCLASHLSVLSLYVARIIFLKYCWKSPDFHMDHITDTGLNTIGFAFNTDTNVSGDGRLKCTI